MPSWVPPHEPMYLWICLLLTAFKTEGGHCANKVGSPGDFVFNHTIYSHGKIVNGTTATPHKYPSILALQYKDYHTICGATILDKYWALTAAHCVMRISASAIPTDFSLYAGVHDNSRLTEPHIQRVTVTQIIPHKLYGTAGFGYDIALMKVEPPFIFTSKVAPVNLPDCDFRVEVDGKGACISRGRSACQLQVFIKLLCHSVIGYAAGWGNQIPIPNPPAPSPLLQEVDLPLVTTETCQQVYGWVQAPTYNYSIPIDGDDVICAGYKEGGKDSCGGDSGGPLFVYNDEDQTYTQVGIVAWGNTPACAAPNFYSVNTMVPKYVDWIKWNMKNCTTKRSGRALQ